MQNDPNNHSPAHNPRLSPPPRPVGVEPPREDPRHSARPPEGDAFATYNERRREINTTLRIIFYVAAVLAVDLLASLDAQFIISWGMFRWRPDTFFPFAEAVVNALNLPYGFCAWMRHPLVQGLDFFKLIFWLIVPLIFTWKKMEWAWWRTTRWRNMDWWILAGITIIGVCAMLSIKYIPALQEFYPSRAGLSFAQKADFVVMQLIWIASWIVGYEFLHRYVLLQRISKHWPRWGWLLIPLFDGAYHLAKAWPEIAGMVLFALFLTWWARTRRNFLLPLAAHLIIEIELVIFLVLF